MLERVSDFYHQKVAGSFAAGRLGRVRGVGLNDLMGGPVGDALILFFFAEICGKRFGLALSDRPQVCFLCVV